MRLNERANERSNENTQPSAGDNLTGLAGWPKVLSQFGLIGVVTLLMVAMVFWQRADWAAVLERQRQDSGAALDIFRRDREVTIQEARDAHQQMQKLTTAIDNNARATWRLVEELRGKRERVGPDPKEAGPE